ncbi:hypothetical protein E0Z10_g885 [Xylaria hypoxylon]|uniref:Programmed cell death protein 5 n=1 Tax=Xylaria hypoxylon TaxID=37992 RepID=A0A4Z0ZGC7_9PEZI|nr:hypothetical protein E0Z10_g885 [Xylaria hypoxylon]
MADADLEQIRKARLEQLKAQQGGGSPGGGSGGQNQAEAQQHGAVRYQHANKQTDKKVQYSTCPSRADTTHFPATYPPTSLLRYPLSFLIKAPPPTNTRKAEARQSILNQILHPEAADRLGRIRLVKESRATEVENRLITLARTGQLRQKVTEAQLKELLSAVAENKEEEKIVVNRRKGWDDEDDDLLDL